MEKRYELPSRKYFAEQVIPDICERLKVKVAEMISDINYISITDTWTADTTTQSFMGITGHWLTDFFVRHSVVFQCTAFDEHHTAKNLLEHFEMMLEKWTIAREKCHVEVRDNAFNIAKCFRDGSYSSVGCFAHTLQLYVRDGILGQKYIVDIISICRKWVGHFKHSSSATSSLHELQVELNLPKHNLIQDVTTRWNSTFYMLQRLLEQQRSISLYCSEVDSVTRLTAVAVISADHALITIVIPLVKTLTAFLQKEGNVAGIITMKAALLEAVSRRFEDIEYNIIYTCATLLDPRLKLCFFSERGRCDARAHLKLVANSMIDSANTTIIHNPSATASICVLTSEDTARYYESNLWSFFDTILEENTTTDITVSADVSNINTEVTQYLSEPIQTRQSNPVSWWHAKRQRFPSMARLAQAFLAPLPTSVSSERLFSTAGDIITDHRSCLLPQNAETLIFLKYNYSLLDAKASTSQPECGMIVNN